MITIGVMSGTSLDGADAVIASFPEDEKAPMATLGRAYLPMPGELREELKALALGTTNEIERAGDASVALADLYAAVIEKALQEAGIGREVVAAVGLHGQTIRHRPERGFTLQLNHPARVAELTGIDVVADFRSRGRRRRAARSRLSCRNLPGEVPCGRTQYRRNRESHADSARREPCTRARL